MRIDGQDVVEAVPQSSVVAFGKSANQFGSDHRSGGAAGVSHDNPKSPNVHI